MLNFYASPFSPYATKVHFFLEESGIPYKYHGVNPSDAAGKAQLADVTPFGKVPAIELNGFTLAESNAILRYLAGRYERYEFYPLNLEDRAGVDAAAEFSQQHVASPLMDRAWHLHWAPKFGMAVSQEKAAVAAEQLQRSLPRLDSYLAGKTFLAGTNLTLADFALWPFAWQAKEAQVSFADFANIEAWRSRMAARPAWKKVVASLEAAWKASGT